MAEDTQLVGCAHLVRESASMRPRMLARACRVQMVARNVQASKVDCGVCARVHVRRVRSCRVCACACTCGCVRGLANV